MERMIFHPPAVRAGEWQRLFSYGLIHANHTHLIFNMFTLYLFGRYIENSFTISLGKTEGSICFILLWLTALPISILPTYTKQKNNSLYNSLGASGAVSAIVFAYILINPMNFMGILFIPIMLPAFLFGLIFLSISFGLEKREPGGINHSAHITGAIWGIIFMIITFQLLTENNLIHSFIAQIKINSLSDLFHFGF